MSEFCFDELREASNADELLAQSDDAEQVFAYVSFDKSRNVPIFTIEYFTWWVTLAFPDGC
jgi:hypothetical protein